MRLRLLLPPVLLLAACGPSRPEANQAEPAPVRVEVAPVQPPEPALETNPVPASSNMIAEESGDWPQAIDTGSCPFEPPSDPPPPCDAALPPVPQPGSGPLPPQDAPVAVEEAIERARADQPMFGVVGARPALLARIRGSKQKLAASKNPSDQAMAAQLAELYAELAEMEHRAAGGTTSSPAERTARQEAIRYYDEVSRNAPNFPMLDQITYQRSWQYERLGDLSNARRSYFELIQKFPTSRLIPSAYFAFGELFYKESFADPSKWVLAEQAYKEVLKFPPPSNRVAGFAQFRLGHVQWRTQQEAAALVSMRRTIELGYGSPALPGAEELREAGVNAAAAIYADKGHADRACPFFHQAVGSPQATLTALDRLADAYWARGDKRSAAMVHGLLRRYDRSPHACFHEAVLRAAR